MMPLLLVRHEWRMMITNSDLQQQMILETNQLKGAKLASQDVIHQ